jgi:cutinase
VNRRPARAAAVAVAALLALGGCFAQSNDSDRPTARPLLSSHTCADLVVVGARGSMQSADRNLGVGTEVRVTVEQLARRLHRRSGVTVHVEPVLYDSSPTPTAAGFLRNTAAGGTLALDRLASLATECPSSRFALVGFSQGAHVVHTAAMAVPTSVRSRIALVAMIADPTDNPDDPITRWSYAAEPTRGHGRLGAGPPIPTALRRAAISFCVAGDAICNDRGAPGSGQSPTHKHFYERPATARVTAARLDRVLRANGV